MEGRSNRLLDVRKLDSLPDLLVLDIGACAAEGRMAKVLECGDLVRRLLQALVEVAQLLLIGAEIDAFGVHQQCISAVLLSSVELRPR